jgi:SAM-dependent methyltransferase
MGENWSAGDLYEPYVGRWSRLVARAFVEWLDVKRGADWLDVGCGTGALTQTILERADPRSVVGIDASREYVDYAAAHTPDDRAKFTVADAQDLTLEPSSVDASVSGLCLNFVPEPARAVAEMCRVTRPGGRVAAYVWDYAEGVQFIRHFWDAAIALDPQAAKLDEGPRFPLCRPEAMHELWSAAGLSEVEVTPIEIETPFRDFEDYWSPFTGGQGPAPAYAMSLPEGQRAAVRERLRRMLVPGADGRIVLRARAWAARGRVA